MIRWRFAALLLVVALATVSVPAQTGPRFATYYTTLQSRLIEPGYGPKGGVRTFYGDVNGDGQMDAVVLASYYPPNKVNGVSPVTDYAPQPGRLLLGDGNGNFALATAAQFPTDPLITLYPIQALFDDFNGDGRADLFVASSGWDANPWPGEQNRLFLSRPQSGWTDETATLPQLSDFTLSAAAGDVTGRGILDIFVGNGFAAGGKPVPYFLTNTGTGQFVQNSASVPVRTNQMLDSQTAHNFNASALADLDADALPDLVVGASVKTSADRLRNSTVFWNRAGVFTETSTTALPAPSVLPDLRVNSGLTSMDVNQDGLLDLLQVGFSTSNGNAGGAGGVEHGWFVQILVNQGNRRFVDETGERLGPADASQGLDDVTSVAVPRAIKIVDFNNDGAPDFAVDFAGASFKPGLPLVWINDGNGHFSTFKVSDFVPAGQESVFGVRIELVPTRNGYSFFTFFARDNLPGLRLSGLLATRPIH